MGMAALQGTCQHLIDDAKAIQHLQPLILRHWLHRGSGRLCSRWGCFLLLRGRLHAWQRYLLRFGRFLLLWLEHSSGSWLLRRGRCGADSLRQQTVELGFQLLDAGDQRFPAGAYPPVAEL